MISNNFAGSKTNDPVGHGKKKTCLTSAFKKIIFSQGK